MNQARALAPASLSPQLIRRGHPVRRRMRAIIAPVELAPAVAQPAPWAADLRFFVTCYLAGLILFFVMLS